jgi:hypothetical protein
MTLSPSSMWSSSVSALAPATKQCRMLRAYPSASITQASSTLPRLPPPSSLTKSTAQEAVLVAVTARISDLASTSRGTQPPATTPETKSGQPLPRATGRTAFSCPSRRRYTIVDMLDLDAHTSPVCRLSQRGQRLRILARPSCPRTMTKISPSHPSRFTAHIDDCHHHELHAHLRLMSPVQLAFDRAASMLLAPLGRARPAKTMPTCSCTSPHLPHLPALDQLSTCLPPRLHLRNKHHYRPR